MKKEFCLLVIVLHPFSPQNTQNSEDRPKPSQQGPNHVAVAGELNYVFNWKGERQPQRLAKVANDLRDMSPWVQIVVYKEPEIAIGDSNVQSAVALFHELYGEWA